MIPPIGIPNNQSNFPPVLAGDNETQSTEKDPNLFFIESMVYGAIKSSRMERNNLNSELTEQIGSLENQLLKLNNFYLDLADLYTKQDAYIRVSSSDSLSEGDSKEVVSSHSSNDQVNE